MNGCIRMNSNFEIIDILGNKYYFENATIGYDNEFTTIYDECGIKIAMFTNKNIIVTLKEVVNNE